MEPRSSSSTTSSSARRQPDQLLAFGKSRGPLRSGALVNSLGVKNCCAAHLLCAPLASERLFPALPLDGAALSGPQRLENPKRLGDRTADVGILVERVLQDSLGIDDERGSVGMALFLDETAVFLRNLALDVRKERIGQRS